MQSSICMETSVASRENMHLFFPGRPILISIYSDNPPGAGFPECFTHDKETSVYMCAQSCPTLCKPMNLAHQAPLSMGFSRQNTGEGCHFLLPWIFLTQVSNHVSCISWVGRLILYHWATWEGNPWTVACHASLSITISWCLFKLLSIEAVMPSNHLLLCCPLHLPSVSPSISVFSNESALRIR